MIQLGAQSSVITQLQEDFVAFRISRDSRSLYKLQCSNFSTLVWMKSARDQLSFRNRMLYGLSVMDPERLSWKAKMS